MDRGLEPVSGGVGWCYVCVRCESGLSVLMAGPGICVLFLAETCAYEVQPVLHPVAPCRYLLPSIYLCRTDIANPDSFCLMLSDLDLSRHRPLL